MNLSFKKKVMFFVGFPAVVLLCSGIFGMWKLYTDSTSEVQTIKEVTTAVDEISVMKVRFGTMVQEWKNVLLRGKSAKQFKKYSERIPKRYNDMKAISDGIKPLLKKERADLIPELEKFDAQLAKLYKGYMGSMNKNLLPDDFNAKQADKDVSGMDRGALKRLNFITEELTKHNNQIVENGKNHSEQLMMLFAGVMAGIGFVIFGFVYFMISKTDNVLMGMASTLNKSAENLKENSNLLEQRGVVLAESVTEQASSLQETVSTVNEISSMINKNAQGAKASLEISKESMNVATNGKQTVNKMMNSINEIKQSNDVIMDEMAKSNEEISDIVKVILEIGEKTKVINDIVFQTKLLSFNASVEAARAGEHGKGFSVVAEEVGNLASMSGKSASEISDMIDMSIKKVTEIVDKTKETVERLTKDGAEKANHGTQMASECGEVFESVLTNVTKVNDVVEEIATATEEQAKGVDEINKAVSQLDEVTQQSANIANEASKIGQDVNKESSGLSDISYNLTSLLTGSNDVKSYSSSDSSSDNVLSFENKTEPAPVYRETKKVVGGENFESYDDSDFEDL